MKIKTRGIVLYTTEYSETSLIVKVYTEEAGLSSFIVSGVRTKNSRFKSNLFQPLTLIELEASGKPGQTLRRITEIQLAPPLSSIPADVIKSSIAIFLAEIIYRTIREEEPNRSLFNFIHNAIQILDISRHNCSRFHIFFMIQLSRYIGFYPHGVYIPRRSNFDLREGTFTESMPGHSEYIPPETAAYLCEMMGKSFENFHELIIPGAATRQLLHSLVRYYELHLTHGQVIMSHKVLEDVLN